MSEKGGEGKKRVVGDGLSLEAYSSFASRLNSAVQNIECHESDGRSGWVYVAQLDDQSLTKIGMTRQFDPRARIGSIVGGLDGGRALVIRGIAKSKTPRKMERVLHAVFADKRARGEWFRLTCDDLDLIFLSGQFTHSHQELNAIL